MNPILTLIFRGLVLLFIYVFVGWITYIIFKGIRAFSNKQSTHFSPEISLKTNLNQENYEKEFNQLELIIGRSSDSDFSIPDETVSLKHCHLFYDHQQWWADDLNSTNGSFLNETLIDSPVVLTNGDVLRLGNVTINIQILNKTE